jgi:phage tail-like protein
MPPFSGAHFRVLIGDTEVGFCHVSRLHLTDTADPQGTAPGASPRPLSVVLKRAITQDKELYRWRARVAAGKRDLRTVFIHQCDAGGEAILNTWVLHGCQPVRWSGPEFNALASDVLWEEVEIGCERLEWL